MRLPKLGLTPQLLIALAIALFFGKQLPLTVQSFFYSLSITLKDALLFVLPLVIFSCLFSCLLSFQGKQAIKFMLGLFSIVFLSNLFSVFLGYGVYSLGLIKMPEPTQLSLGTELHALWSLHFPKWISNQNALLLGLLFGIFFAFFPNPKAKEWSNRLKAWSILFLEKGFIPVLPLFVFGFIVKMQYDGALSHVFGSYLNLLIVITIVYAVYLSFLFLAAARFNFNYFFTYIRNIMPVGLMAFTTMSSLATMPITLKASEKNTQDPQMTQSVVPATVNIHLIGVAICIPIMALAVLSSFGFTLPSFAAYAHFALFFALTQFTTAGVPAGGIIIMMPLLESFFGFTGEMSALITTLYIIYDPAVTIANVLGNSALVIMISRLFAIKPAPALAE